MKPALTSDVLQGEETQTLCPCGVWLNLQTCPEKMKNFKHGDNFNEKKNAFVQDKETHF